MHPNRQSFYDLCEKIVDVSDIAEKVRCAYQLTQSPYVAELKNQLKSSGDFLQPSPLAKFPYDLKPVKDFSKRTPGRPIHFDIRGPRDIEKRPSLATTEGLRHLIHSIAHIELSAVEIDAAMLAAYPHAPLDWVVDWVGILGEEQRHFLLLCGLLKDLNGVYGELPIHFGLWQTAMLGRTWLEQVAIVNRYQEAGGVDSSQFLVQQLRELKKDATATVIERIHDDEIRHVHVGNRWWTWAFSHYRLVSRENTPLSEEMGKYFFNLIEKRIPRPWAARVPIDQVGRRKCGFSQFELQQVEELKSQR